MQLVYLDSLRYVIVVFCIMLALLSGLMAFFSFYDSGVNLKISDNILALHAESRSYAFDITKKNFFSNFSRNKISAVTSSDDKLLFLDTKGSLYLISKDNTVNWISKVSENKESDAVSLVYVNNNIFCVINNIIYGIDFKTGNIKWSKEFRNIIGHPVFDLQNSRVAVLTIDNYLYMLDSRSGAMVWSYQDIEPDFVSSKLSSPVIDNGIIFVPFVSDALLKSFRSIDGQLLLEYKIPEVNKDEIGNLVHNVNFTPITFKNHILVADRKSTIIDFDINSGKVLWSKKIKVDFLFSAGQGTVLTIINNNLFLMTIDTGKFIWKSDLNNSISSKKKNIKWSSPVLLGDKVLISSSDGLLFKVDINSGKILEIKKIPSKFWSYAAVLDSFFSL